METGSTRVSPVSAPESPATWRCLSPVPVPLGSSFASVFFPLALPFALPSSSFSSSCPFAGFASHRAGAWVQGIRWREKGKATGAAPDVANAVVATASDPSDEALEIALSMPTLCMHAFLSRVSLWISPSSLWRPSIPAGSPSGSRQPRGSTPVLFVVFFLLLLFWLFSLLLRLASPWPLSCPLGALLLAEAKDFRFDSLEIAHRSPDLHHPLPYPVDASACGLAALRRLGERLRESTKQTSSRHTWRRGEETSEILEKAMKTGVVIEKLERRLDMKRQVKVTIRTTVANHGASAVENLAFLLPFHEAVQVGWMAAKQNGQTVSFDAISERPRISSFSPHTPASLSHDALLFEEVDQALQVAAGVAADSPSGGRSGANDLARSTREEGEDECRPLLLELHLRKPLEPQGRTHIEITYILGRAYRPVPRAAPLGAVQSVLFVSTSAWPSPYPVLHGSSTAVALAPGTSLGPAGATRIMKKYGFKQESQPDGPWMIVAPGPTLPFEVGQPFVLHMPLPLHLGYFLSAERFVEVSHFGNIFFHEWYRLHNDAAKLEGSYDAITAAALQGIQPGAPRFSRHMKKDEVNDPREPPASHMLTHLVAALPKRAFSLEVFDQIGNVSSTRAARVGPEAQPIYTELELYPRFPLLGGWNTDFQVQYNLPARTVMVKHADAHRYTLNLTLAPPFRDIYTEDVFLNIALPSGAQNVTVTSPRKVDWNVNEKLHSWLDVFTFRPLLKLHFPSSFVPDRNILQFKVQVSYDYPPFLAVEVFKQLQICLLVFVLFLLLILSRRLRVSIACPREKEKQETEETAMSVMRHLLEVFEEISQSSDDLIEGMHRLRASASSREQNSGDGLSQWKARMARASETLEKHLELLDKEQQAQFFPGLRASFQVYRHHVEGLATCLKDLEDDNRKVSLAQARADLAASELLQRIRHPERRAKPVVESADLRAVQELQRAKKED
ncbi:ribophorin i protein [Toxoplasma gondii ME49]|uniref:Dolichyl-diphosphooligosaccharide--protein glycosyltransferase subunit 1 n=1 Tax=Toxoplasma gondii (strain ATCC 50611 / Me49) TaxID=508771 RepID=S8GNS1_TOXGM|nr:ribophorin i protein [Toxoplasma gondii ME49]EPT30209.1 ribophorin i protein [Toxoplasma gondii ME49]|eukprot:XP_018637395.1 ribophorin i protein [Toxoplasma gondii ME49]